MSAKEENKEVWIENGGQFLFDTGLLFEINRRILHPLGVALMVELSEDGSTYVLSNHLMDCRQDESGIIYDPQTLKLAEDKLWKFMEDYGVGKMQERQRNMGFVVQKSDVKRQTDAF